SPGSSGSSRPPQPFTIPEQAQDALAILRWVWARALTSPGFLRRRHRDSTRAGRAGSHPPRWRCSTRAISKRGPRRCPDGRARPSQGAECRVAREPERHLPIRASVADAESGLAALRTTTDENEAHRRVTAAEIASNLAQVSTENAKLRESAARNRLSGGVITNCFEEMPDGA